MYMTSHGCYSNQHGTSIFTMYPLLLRTIIIMSQIFFLSTWCLGGFTPSYILHTRAFGTYLLGGYLPCKKNIRWWYFTCKNPKNVICHVILHVKMFEYFKIPYFTCTFLTKFIYNECIGPYISLHIVLRFLPVNSLSMMYMTCSIHTLFVHPCGYVLQYRIIGFIPLGPR